MWDASRFGPCGSSEGRRLADERLPRAEASLAEMAGASHRPGQRMHSSIGHASIEAWIYGRDGLGLVFCRFSSEEVRKQKAGNVACLRKDGSKEHPQPVGLRYRQLPSCRSQGSMHRLSVG